MEYETYIDVSGNTGNDLMNNSQKFFCLSAVSIPLSQAESLEKYIQREFESVKEKGEKEIKATRWIKNDKKNKVLQDIIQQMETANCDFSTVIIEKRYMLAALIVDNFLDGAYNDNKDYTWCNNKEEKIEAAQYFYNILSDEDFKNILPAFKLPSIENAKKAIQIVIERTQDLDYKKMLDGCHVEELFNVLDNTNVPNNILYSPNYTAFVTLGNMVANHAHSKGYQTKIIFDDCLLCNDTYKQIFNIFEKMRSNPLLKELTGLFSWKDYISSFTTDDSQKTFLLQTADIMATSTLNSSLKIFNQSELNSYDKFIVGLMHKMYKEKGLWFVINEQYYNFLVSYNKHCQNQILSP